jgi:hypothetical protein
MAKAKIKAGGARRGRARRKRIGMNSGKELARVRNKKQGRGK